MTNTSDWKNADFNWQHRPTVNKLLVSLVAEDRLIVLSHALSKHPDDGFLHGHYGRSCLHVNKFHKAIEHLTQAAQSQTGDASVPFSLGIAYTNIDNLNNALPWFEQAVKLGKKADHILILVRTACEIKQYNIALDACKLGLQVHANDERIQCAYPQTLVKNHQHEEALDWLEKNDTTKSKALAQLKYKIYAELNHAENAKLAHQEYLRRQLHSQPNYREDAIAVLSSLPNNHVRLALAAYWQNTLNELTTSRELDNNDHSTTEGRTSSNNIQTSPARLINQPIEPINLAMSILVRDEVDIIEHNIRYHAAMGVSHFVVTDNGSKDGTRETLEMLSKELSLTIIDEPSHTIDQDLWVTRMADTIKATGGYNWIIHNDADEFWHPRNGNSLSMAISEQLQLSGVMQNDVGVLSCRRFNMIGSLEDAQSSNYLFYHNAHLVKKNVPLLPGEKQWSNDSTNTVARNIMDKIMTRTDGLSTIDYGNHGATHELLTENCETVTIYHYPVRTYDQFERKVKNYGESLANNTRYGTNSSVHLRHWYQQFLEGNLKSEYNSIAFTQSRLTELENQRYLKKTDTISSFFNSASIGTKRQASG